jgi:hypothetical protein
LAGFKEIKNVIPVSEGDSSRDADLNAVIPSTETLVNNVPEEDLQFDQQNKDQFELDAEIPENVAVQNVRDARQSQQPTIPEPTERIMRTRTRIIKRPERLIEVGYSSYYEVLHEDDYKLQDDMSNPIAFLSRHSDPDTMYFHEAIQQPDREEFIKAIIKEINDHIR